MLLVECNVLEKVEVINEGKEGNKRLRLRGKFQQCDEQNNNGRIYPRKILEAQVQAIQEKIGDRSLVGALDHPANDAIHLSQASHLITGLNVDKDGSVIGECEILSTPNGKIVEALINDGVKIGISSRGVGSVTEGIKGKIVNEDFKLITFDLVSDPSTRGAFPELTESIRENSQRAQEIVSKHKQERVLLTMLQSKISEALKGKQKKLDKNKNGKLDSEDFKMLRGEKEEGDSVDEKTFPDLSGDGKVTRKDVLIGRGVIPGKKKKKKVQEARDKDPLRLKLLSRQKPAGSKDSKKETPAQLLNKTLKRPPLKKGGKNIESEVGKSGGRDSIGRQDNSTDIKQAVVEGLKKVCWGDSYNESMYKPGEEKRVRKELDQQAKEKPKKPGYDKKYAEEFKKYAEKSKKKK